MPAPWGLGASSTGGSPWQPVRAGHGSQGPSHYPRGEQGSCGAQGQLQPLALGISLSTGSGVGWGRVRRAHSRAGLGGGGHWQGLPWGSGLWVGWGKAWEAEGLIKTTETSEP